MREFRNPVFFCLLFVLGLEAVSSSHPCPNEAYCNPDLLHTVQMAHLYNDSKTFVDKKLKLSPAEVLKNFYKLMNETKQNPTRDQIQRFVDDNFGQTNSEFESWNPEDWTPNPKFLAEIMDVDLRKWGYQLNEIWKKLGRKIKDEVKEHEDMYSIIYVPNPVIVPGGRFREFYYWDSYWVVRGLLLSEMFSTTKGMLENFLSIVETYGFIPNGGRIYYLQRSQPPLLIPMVQSYVETTGDKQFLRDSISTLEKEFKFWIENYTVPVEMNGKTYNLARYNGIAPGPRPESYREDFETASVYQTQAEKENFYYELKAGAESGWDYSSRWYITNGTNEGNLTNLKVRYVIPVDLNAMLYWNAKILTDYFSELRMFEKAAEFENYANELLEAINTVLWDEDVGVWLDYDLINNKRRNYFSVSNIAPLWTKSYKESEKDEVVGKVMKYLEKSNGLHYAGGVPTTLEHSGEQWDFPNAWPPLQYMLIIGLDATGDAAAKELAFQLTETWVRSNWKAYLTYKAMFEKYDCTAFGAKGGGGEYTVQLGFGWTNGVVLELLDKYKDRLTAKEGILASSSTYYTPNNLIICFSVILATLTVASIGFYVCKKKLSGDTSSFCPKWFGGYIPVNTSALD